MSAFDSTFQDELRKWGPDCVHQSVSLAEANAYCRQLCSRHYENFVVASWLLPKRLRQDFATVYAYCRWSDDLADEVGETRRSLELLAWWQQQLEACFRVDCVVTHPVFISLRETIHKHKMSVEPFEQLLSAFRQDQTTHRYQTRQELLHYCESSANPVGRLVLRMAAADSQENVSLSDSICTGLQLANFCQDMAVDVQKGRIYCPAELWHEFGVTEIMLLEGKVHSNLRKLLEDWCGEARACLVKGWKLADQVPHWLRVDIELFIRGGLAILDAIGRQGYDVWTKRPTVSKIRKIQLLLVATCHSYFKTIGRFARP